MKPVMGDAWNGEAGKLEKRAHYLPPPEDAVMRQAPSEIGSLHSPLQWVRLNTKSAGCEECRCWNQQLLLGSKVVREEIEVFLWHQLYQHSLCEALRSAPFLMGVCANLCIMLHRVML